MKSNARRDLVKIGIGAGIISGFTFLGYEAIQAFTGTTGGSCSQSGTPCYECMQPFQKELATLTIQFNAYYAATMSADAAANSGITEEQQAIINNYTAQIDTQILGIQQCAKQYTPTTWESIAGGIVTAIIIVGVGVAIARIIKSLYSFKEPPQNRNGGGGGWISNMLMLANIQDLLNTKKITPENVSALSTSAINSTSLQQEQVSGFTSIMVEDNLISAAAAAALDAAMAIAMTEDTTLILAAFAL